MTRRAGQRPSRRERIQAALGALLINAALGLAFLTGLALRQSERPAEPPLETFDVTVPPPPPEIVAVEESSEPKPAPAGASGARASPVAAPPSPLPSPNPAPATPSTGSATTSGTADRSSGPGSGGAGSGSGGGGAGNGGGLPVSRAVPIRGLISNRDNPGSRYGGRVVVNLAIDAEGQVTGCRLVESSGDPATDGITCQLSRRILFRPARLGDGRAVPDTTFYVVNWRRR